MAELVDRIRKELDARIEQLRPLVGEFERLERAAAALARAGARAAPGVGVDCLTGRSRRSALVEAHAAGTHAHSAIALCLWARASD
jgi:hypothetical protein